MGSGIQTETGWLKFQFWVSCLQRQKLNIASEPQSEANIAYVCVCTFVEWAPRYGQTSESAQACKTQLNTFLFQGEFILYYMDH